MQPSSPTCSDLTAQQRIRVDGLLDELLDLPEEARASHLRDLQDEDPIVLAEVESLMLAAQASGGFLGAPARAAIDDVVQDAAIGTRLGAWTITRLIGRGGMGDVYEGLRTQGDFEQRVAIKLLQRDAASQLERFEAERQILARLEHSGIARLYDGGVTSDGRPFMVMEYVEGRSITDFCMLTHAATRAFHSGVRRCRLCAPQLDRSSRSQAIKYPSDCGRGGEAARFWHCQAARPAARSHDPGRSRTDDTNLRRARAVDRRPHHHCY